MTNMEFVILGWYYYASLEVTTCRRVFRAPHRFCFTFQLPFLNRSNAYNFVLSKNINRPMSSCGHNFLLLKLYVVWSCITKQLSTPFWYTLIYLTSIVYSTPRYCLLQGFFSSGRQHTLIVVLLFDVDI